MRKVRIVHRIRVNPPVDDVEPSPKKRVRRVERPGSPVALPADAAFWTLKNEQGKRLSAFSSNGAQVFTWPIEEFTVETIRERWGGGSFVAFFTTAKGTPLGRRPFAIQSDAPAPPAHEVRSEVVPAGPLVHEDSLERSIRLLTAVDGLASRKASEMVATQSEFLRSAQSSTVQLFQAAMGQKLAEQKMQQAALPAQLEQLLVRFDQRLTQIEAALSDDEDPEDPEDGEDPDAEPKGVPSLPEEWRGIGDMMYRLLARQLPTLEKALPGLLDRWLADLQAKAAEQGARTAAANGVPTTAGVVP